MAKSRREFPAFPFDPYPIQLDFMAALYDSLDKGGVAMLESPTGTGKTLSIICSALQWIVDQRERSKSERKRDDARAGDGAEEEPDWMRDFVVDVEEGRPLRTKKKSAGIKTDSSNLTRNRGDSQKVEEGSLDAASQFDEKEFLLEEYESEEEEMSGIGGKSKKKKRGAGSIGSSSEEEEEGSGGPGDEIEVAPKVYFSSRTHSQLTQFVRELKRTKFASELNAVCLGSRKNLCINEGVLNLGNTNRINERCLELQKNQKDKNAKESRSKVQSGGARTNRTKASFRCPMLKKQSLQAKFRNAVLEEEILDIEDLVDLGRKIGTCPYYGSRRVVPAADLVVLPYQSLLLKSARESLGLNLKNNIVIIDEAHNLADSLTNMYNSRITVSQLENVQSHLEMYLDRFWICLGAGNRRYIQTLLFLTKAFLSMLLRDENDANCAKSSSVEKFPEVVGDSSLTINEFLFALDIDNINLVKLCRYIKESNIIHKVSGYGTKITSLQGLPGYIDGQNNIQEGTIVASFQALSDILFSLTYSDDDGRVIVSRRGHLCPGQFEEGYLKFVMLSGDKIFSEIMDQAHAVVLAGGTLQPIEETRIRLFPGLPLDKVHFFSCSHIIPPESILPIAICRGPSGMTFDFSYNSRCSPNMMDELGRLLCNLVAVTPEGIVVFFSSFEYEGQVYQAWKTSGILMRILKKKHVFREPRSSLDVEETLKKYKEAIFQCKSMSGDNRGPCGALLLAVVGGKISEGINFSDGMGRCVVMVGLPYPNPRDVGLMERVKHIDGLGEPRSSSVSKSLGNSTCDHAAVQLGFGVLKSCKQRGREYYDNLCMKAVNQSVGRAIRHIKDYAAILLVDSRYASKPLKTSFPHPTDKLPLWIRDRLVFATQSYGEVHRLLHQFFQFNKQRTQVEIRL